MKEKLTQKKLVLAHLKAYGSIEPLTALREYGCYRLSHIIYLLRGEGYVIDTEEMMAKSKITGNPVRFANYKLKKNEGGMERCPRV